MFTQADCEQLDALGIGRAEAERQIRLFEQPPAPARLERPCTAGDGIARLDEAQQRAALAAWESAAAGGRLLKFVPASGAASRMFKALLSVRQAAGSDRAALAQRADGDDDARETLSFFDQLPQFAFYAALRAAVAARGGDLDVLRERGEIAPILAALLTDVGLDYAALPKGLLLFHGYPDGARTAFEEHLVEGAAYARDAQGRVRLHLTVSPEHRRGFERRFAAVRAAYERRGEVHYALELSTQLRSTDTLAVDLDNRPVRARSGRLLLRPGGHGALIENLNQLRGDLVFIKNIDNVQPDHLRPPALAWLRLLTGHLAVLQAELVGHLRALSAPAVPASARAAAGTFAHTALGAPIDAGAEAAALIEALDRPLRVCGVVRNSGEPGGGPFWVRNAAGRVSKQIVESAEVDASDPGQRAVFAAATHFNPVLLACGLRDWRGEPFDLHQFVDPDAVFIARKSHEGRELKALERPGLWNGAMARWHTVFVEVPDTTFTPVKTVNDLLRPAHQGPG